MTMITISVLTLLALILSSITVTFSILAYSKVVGLENSTHKVQYMPVDEFKEYATEEEEDMGMPITRAQKVEESRVEKLGDNFGQMYEETV